MGAAGGEGGAVGVSASPAARRQRRLALAPGTLPTTLVVPGDGEVDGESGEGAEVEDAEEDAEEDEEEGDDEDEDEEDDEEGGILFSAP